MCAAGWGVLEEHARLEGKGRFRSFVRSWVYQFEDLRVGQAKDIVLAVQLSPPGPALSFGLPLRLKAYELSGFEDKARPWTDPILSPISTSII